MGLLSEIYDSRFDRIAVTAHRGASYDYPENSLIAMSEAVKAGANFIEFDLRVTQDGEIVVLHDLSIDRTSDGSGMIADLTLAEARAYNYSFFRRNKRHVAGLTPEVEIPTFEDILENFSGKVAMNIQVYVGSGDGLKAVCELYKKYELFDNAFLTIADLEMAKAAREYAPGIDICLTPGWQDRSKPENLKLCHDFGCRFVQPVREFSNAETFKMCDELNLFSNVFYADEPTEFQELINHNARGILTNRSSDLVKYLKNNKLY